MVRFDQVQITDIPGPGPVPVHLWLDHIVTTLGYLKHFSSNNHFVMLFSFMFFICRDSVVDLEIVLHIKTTLKTPV